MNVISLFDGMSCGMLALKKAHECGMTGREFTQIETGRAKFTHKQESAFWACVMTRMQERPNFGGCNDDE